MSTIPTKVGFPPTRKVRPGVQGIRFPLNGRAPTGWWNHKLAFGVEVIRTRPSAVVVESRPAKGVPALDPGTLERAMAERTIRRRAFHLAALPASDFPRPVFYSPNVLISVLTGMPNPAIRSRHAEAHALAFVHRGRGTVATDLGALEFEPGDFLHIPKGVTYAFRAVEPVVVLLYEFPAKVMRPYHYWIEGYPFADTAPVPAEPVEIEDAPGPEGDYPVYVKRLVGPWTVLRYPFSPFDAVAWEGNLYPFVVHLRDLRALSSPDFHLDPKALTVFTTEDEGIYLQVFLPRWVHSLPYPHQNDVDEILFNHSGYHARPEVKDGYCTLHPTGTFHGPDVRVSQREVSSPEPPKWEQPWRNEIGVMIEAKAPFVVLPDAETVEVPDYDRSWLRQYQELQAR